jgi:N-ethylmaleimide reductase
MSNLFNSLNLAIDLTLKNRIVLAPLTRGRAGAERLPNELMAEYYGQRASAGLIITEATSISTDGIGWLNNPGIWSERQVEGWSLVTNKVHSLGGKIFLQLWHCGRASHSSFPERNNKLPASASAIKISSGEIHTPLGKLPYETPRALTLQEIKETVSDYRQAAKNAKHAGFDGVEIHSANGYLIDQFLQTKTNHRSDEFGGSLENRYRFLSEVCSACLEVWPSERVGVRLSPNGIFNDMGSSDFRETFLFVAEKLNQLNLAYLHLLDGLAFGFHNQGEPLILGDFRKIFKKIIIANCGYTQESAELAIGESLTDLVAFGRAYISNPDLVERFKNSWPLTVDATMDYWYSQGAKGYTDYPFYSSSLIK